MISIVIFFNALLGLITLVAGQHVTCRSVIKLRNSRGAFLHSHEIPYGSGSGQQSVTGLDHGDDGGGYWEVVGAQDAPCQQTMPISKGQRIRLNHVETSKWLHSHTHKSPLTANQEISAYGGPSQSDTGDVWTVTWNGSNKLWEKANTVFLQHVDTGMFVADTGKMYGRPINGQHEIAGVSRKDNIAGWIASYGMYLHTSTDDDPPAAKDGHSEL
eukprot:jgi/Ulvmu1/9043/UM005_0136.1